MAALLEKWTTEGLSPKFTAWNKRNPEADPAQCGRYRPDFVWAWDEGVLLLEFDEGMHSDYERACELKRMGEASLGYGGRPVQWIRFNPDAFKKDGATRRTTKKEREEELLELLGNGVLPADYEHFLTIDYVCYDPQPGAFVSGLHGLVQTLQFETIEDYCAWAEAA